MYGKFHLVVGHLVGEKVCGPKHVGIFFNVNMLGNGIFSDYFALLAYHIFHFNEKVLML